jgi:hypothetical protein
MGIPKEQTFQPGGRLDTFPSRTFSEGQRVSPDWLTSIMPLFAMKKDRISAFE